MAFAGTGQRRKSVKLKNFLTNAVRGVKSFVVNKAIGNFNASDLVSNWTSQNTAYNGSNKSEIQALLKKSPFEKAKDRKTSIKETDPLGFQHIQYPADLTGNELGNWILFFTINSNLHGGASRAAEMQFSKRMGMPKATKSHAIREFDRIEGRTSAYGPADTMREQYREAGIHIPRVVMENTVSEGYKSQDYVSGAIALYMPPDIKVSYGAEWGSEDAMLAGDVSKLWKDIQKSDKHGWDLVESVAAHGTGIGLLNLQKALGALGEGAGIGDWVKILGKNMGMAVNNHKEQVFENPTFREFSYQFKFFPKNSDETNRVQKIIAMFKYHMHPWKDNENWNGRLFQYPSEFEIHYLRNGTDPDTGKTYGGINSKLHKISRCDLKKCDVNYSPEGGNFKTFKDHSPVTYTIDLNFVELEFMTKQKILEGF